MDALFYHESIVTPISPLYFFSITLLYISLNIMKLLNVIKIITTCDSQVDHNM
jgi:hypothetical protein